MIYHKPKYNSQPNIVSYNIILQKIKRKTELFKITLFLHNGQNILK